ncbi:MAG: hypothetical protein RSB99_01885 [Bacilli bacterium]
MKEIKVESLSQIDGGINISGTLINSFGSIIKILLEVGRSIGSALRRIDGYSMCKL